MSAATSAHHSPEAESSDASRASRREGTGWPQARTLHLSEKACIDAELAARRLKAYGASASGDWQWYPVMKLLGPLSVTLYISEIALDKIG